MAEGTKSLPRHEILPGVVLAPWVEPAPVSPNWFLELEYQSLFQNRRHGIASELLVPIFGYSLLGIAFRISLESKYAIKKSQILDIMPENRYFFSIIYSKFRYFA